MATDTNTGMDKADMKRLLAKSKQEPVNCAMGQGSDASFALLILDKIKGAKGVEKDLQKAFPEAKNVRFGTAFVDTEDNPKLAKFRINKTVSGMAKRLVKTLKGTGFTKVEIVLDEDGTLVDSALGEEEADASETPAPAAAPPPPPPHDAGQLAQALKALAGRIAQAAGSDAERRAALLQLANRAQADLKAGNLGDAAAAIGELNHALQAPAAPAATPAVTPAPAAPGTAGAVAYGKARLAWLAARRRMQDDIERLRGQIVAEYQAEGIADDLDQRYTARVAPLLAALDESLADTLDAAGNATDPAQREKLVAEARAVIQRYQGVLSSETLIADLDANPFVPLSIQSTLTATLTALSAAVR